MNTVGTRAVEIRVDDLVSPEVVALVHEHLVSMAPTAPPESRHALDLDGLREPDVTFWSGWDGDHLAGIGALKHLSQEHAEIKSMRTASAYLRQGVASRMLSHIIQEAERRGYKRVSLETGSMEFFEPARNLYAAFGFTPCGPFGSYADDPNSVFMTRYLGISVPAEVSSQLSRACGVIERHVASTLLAVHFHGSALDGGLKPNSDIDLLVTVAARPDEAVRQALLLDLLEVSAPPGQSEALRALEVTVVVRNDIVPWRYPARRGLQFGEWLRRDIRAGIFAPAAVDADLAILLTKAREHSLALAGPSAEELFDPVPTADLYRALADTLKLWNASPDWAGDERNVVLTVARIWYSAATGKIAPKDVAADWVMERLPVEHQPVLLEARQAYLGHREDRLAARERQLAEFIIFAKHESITLLKANAKGANGST